MALIRETGVRTPNGQPFYHPAIPHGRIQFAFGILHRMSKNQRKTPRKPATKFAHLQKKMRRQKVQARKPGKK
jgi:hypothetical protein